MNDRNFNPEDMPILDLDTGGTSRYEASRFLDTPEVISAYLTESMKAQDPHILMQALAEVAKARGVNKVAQDAGINRESLYKSFKGGAHTRFETINRLMRALRTDRATHSSGRRRCTASSPYDSCHSPTESALSENPKNAARSNHCRGQKR